MYDLNCEPGHQQLVDECVHVDLSEYQIGSPRYEQLHAAMQLNNRFQWPSQYEVNT